MMNLKHVVLAAGMVLSGSSIDVNASLSKYQPAGEGLVYSSVSNVSWTRDANLFRTMALNVTNIISLISGVRTSYNDPGWGVQMIDEDDFDVGSGGMSWWGAMAFIEYLNSIGYGGSNRWRLPTMSNIDPEHSDLALPGNELSQLFYSELDGRLRNPIPNTSTFDNEQASGYWSGTQYDLSDQYAWFLFAASGAPGYIEKSRQVNVWPVSPGLVVAAPLPAASWLVGPAILWLFGYMRRATVNPV